MRETKREKKTAREKRRDGAQRKKAGARATPARVARHRARTRENAREAARALRAVQNEQSRTKRQTYLEARARETLLDVWLLPVATSLSTFAALEVLRRRYGPALRQRCCGCWGGGRKKRR